MNFGQQESIPTYSTTIQLKFHRNLMIFSQKHIQEKIVCYTGMLTVGHTESTVLIKIVGLLMLIHMPLTGFPLKRIVFEIFNIIHFRIRNGQTLNPSPGEVGGGLGLKCYRFLST